MTTFTPRRIIGIDVGLNGAIAMMRGETLTGIVDMPTVSLTRNGKAKRQISIPELIAILDEFKPEEAYCERVFAMSGQGVTSVFSFGRSLGATGFIHYGPEASACSGGLFEDGGGMEGP